MDQINPANVYKKFHPNAEGYIFLSAAYATFFKTDNVLGHKMRLNSVTRDLKGLNK